MLDPVHDLSDAAVVGAGLAGLACALELQRRGLNVVLLEASDAPGGRARTNSVDGFLLERGPQFLLTGYPEIQRTLDLRALDLRTLPVAALVHADGALRPVRDLLTPNDVVAIASLIDAARSGPLDRVVDQPDRATLDLLRERGLSEHAIDLLARPLSGLLFHDRTLDAGARLSLLALRALASGDIAIPARGMGEIARSLVSRLTPGTLRLNARAVRIDDGAVTLDTGEIVRARQVVVATEGPEACALLGDALPPVESRAVVRIAYAAERSPIDEPCVVLDAAPDAPDHGPVNDVLVPSLTAPHYAPAGAHTVSATMRGDDQPDDALDRAARDHLARWFGPQVNAWRTLRVLRVPHASPVLELPSLDVHARPSRVRPGVHAVGDHRATPALDGALRSGRLGADAVAHDLGLR